MVMLLQHECYSYDDRVVTGLESSTRHLFCTIPCAHLHLNSIFVAVSTAFDCVHLARTLVWTTETDGTSGCDCKIVAHPSRGGHSPMP